MTLIEKISCWAQTMPEKVAFEDGVQKITYGDLMRTIALYAKKMQEVNCARLGIAGNNSIDWILWDLAALQENIPCVPLPPFFTKEQCRFIISTAGVTHLAEGSSLEKTDVIAAPPLPPSTTKITFTSGSTGKPKGVCLTRSGMEAVAQSIGDVLGTAYAGRHLCVLPLSVLLENVAGVYTALAMGATICVLPLEKLGMSNPFNPDFNMFLKTINDTQATSIILVPELLRGLMSAISTTGVKTPHLKFVAVGGAKVAPELLQQAHILDLPVYEGYGLSECASVVSLNTPAHSKTGSTGKVLPHIKTRIEDGEIVIDNPAFTGYLGEEPRSNTPFPTGDIGNIDSDGFITLQGRKRNIIITTFGRNVSPEWVESHILAQDTIAQVVVYGDATAHLNAFIVPAHPSASAAIADAVDTANSLLPAYARVKSFTIVPPFTVANGMLTGNGRIKRDFILRTFGKETNMTFYECLQQETALQRKSLYNIPQLKDALKGDISRDTYVAYLTEAYHHVRHTVRFLMAMGARLPEEKKWLHDAISEYIDEEKGHEEWILNDIAAAGGDKEAARCAVPNLETQVLVAYNYDYIARKNPVGFLGMVFMLESTSIQIATAGAEAIQKGLGLPKSAFSYLSSHGALDIEHMKFFEKLVSQITDPADEAAIIEVAQNTFRLFAGVLSAIPHKGEKRYAA